jgi:cytochrome P450/NADPH-cytochrome P450 reductase
MAQEKDFIYREELREWKGQGAIQIRPAFSKDGPEGYRKYVHETIWDQREELAELFRNGAKVYVCGSAIRLTKSTADTIKKIWMEKNQGKSEEDAQQWLQEIREERYVSDVFD